ncbi:MAG TPA: preprotein translocase subunit SecA [Miltoncostaeaceae bacterium]|nr:preprotein translocase subunit SecA [Miltoncostaeaceae bacterium]
MSTDLINRVLRIGEGRQMKQMQARVAAIGKLEPEMEGLSDEELRGRSDTLRERAQGGEELDDLLVEAFALVREAGRRSLGMRLYDVQLIGAQVLHSGKIAEMKTGEGKTFACVPAVYLNALLGRGVHLVTVNDYLASRDAEWMRPVYEALGIRVGVIASMMDPGLRREMYACDVTYGTNSEFGFDYLRDNMSVRLEDCVQRGHYFCIVDEVDSILIDEARTPLIISGIPEAASDTYYRFARIVPTLKKGVDYDVDEKHRSVSPTEDGVRKVEKALGIDQLYVDHNGQLVNHLIQALKAHSLYHRDKEYIVRNGEVLIVDEFTGRVLEGRRYSEGLHQAIEAKEGQRIREENQTLATITLQNYFRMYDKLSGMTGTASTEANEFAKIYNADVVTIPPNRPVTRIDEDDYIFKTKDAKYTAVVDDIAEAHEKGQPVLVGTISVEISELLSNLLTQRGVPHNVLNAKQHEREAEVIKDAGRRGAVTIATNMAGRGVDIKLGDGVHDLGGLYVVGTERHESRRIDNQLRGRSGRQGDPGRTRFYLSAEDDLIRIFAGDRIYRILDRLGGTDDIPIESRMLSKTIEGAQKKVEEMNFGIRKRVLEYDDVLNKQREVIYRERRSVLEGADLSERARDWLAEVIVDVVDQYADDESAPAEWDLKALFATLRGYWPVSTTPDDLPLADPEFGREQLLDILEDDIMEAYEERERNLGAELMREIERWVLLGRVDQHWREHLYAMDYLREGIHLRALGQKDPLSEYRLEGHAMFDETMQLIKGDFVRNVFHVDVSPAPEVQAPPVDEFDYTYQDEPVQPVAAAARAAAETDGEVAAAADSPVAVVEQRTVSEEERIGRNDPCWCGSGKKFKKCHGAAA